MDGMSTNEQREKLRQAYRVAVIIGLAMMASLLVYLVIVALIEGGTITLGEQAAIPAGTLELIKFVFLGIAALVFALVRPITRRVLDTGSRPRPRGESPRQEDGRAAPDTGPLANAAVITFALCEMPAILGLVQYFLGRNVSDFYLFLIISLFAFSVHFPRYSQWEEWYRGRLQ
jgi:hypothetical protein